MNIAPETPRRTRAPEAVQTQAPRPARNLLAALITLLVAATTAATANNLPAHGPTAPTPVQQIANGVSGWQVGEYEVTPLASYEVTARILSKKPYQQQDGREGELSPIDLALGWGPMADAAVLTSMNISQKDRWYFVRWRNAPISKTEVIQNSANTHMIAANPEIAGQLLALEPDQVVRFRGYLVQATAEDGWSWKSSTTRSDTGDGSCELFWVEAIEVVPTETFATN